MKAWLRNISRNREVWGLQGASCRLQVVGLSAELVDYLQLEICNEKLNAPSYHLRAKRGRTRLGALDWLDGLVALESEGCARVQAKVSGG